MAGVLSGCVSHPVGPARTFGKYEGKAVTTAQGVLSAVETGRLVARTATAKRAFGPYVAVMGSESEDAASSLQGTFDSIQPPDHRADQLRVRLDHLIADAVAHLTDLRVALRRGQRSEAVRVAEPLGLDAKRISDFIDEHQK